MLKLAVFPLEAYTLTPAPSCAVQSSIEPPDILKEPLDTYTPPPALVALQAEIVPPDISKEPPSTAAVGCSKAADRAAGQRQCIVAVTAAHPDGTAVASHGPAALNDTRSDAVLDRQRAALDPERLAVCRCRKCMAVQINGQTVSIVNCNCLGHHNVFRQPDLALVVYIGQLIQRRDL